MKTTAILIGILTAVFSTLQLSAQSYISHCNSCVKPDNSYKETGYSNKIELENGKSKVVTMRIKKGKDYIISVNGKKSFGNVHFQIKRLDENDNECEILYDNSLEEFAPDYAFTAKQNFKIVVKITSQPVNWFKEKNSVNNIGVILAYK